MTGLMYGSPDVLPCAEPECLRCGDRGVVHVSVRTHEDDGYEVEVDCPVCTAREDVP
jgi:hypothetical protein